MCTKEIYDMYKENNVIGKVASEDEVVPTVLKTLRINNTSCDS